MWVTLLALSDLLMDIFSVIASVCFQYRGKRFLSVTSHEELELICYRHLVEKMLRFIVAESRLQVAWGLQSDELRTKFCFTVLYRLGMVSLFFSLKGTCCVERGCENKAFKSTGSWVRLSQDWVLFVKNYKRYQFLYLRIFIRIDCLAFLRFP